MAEEAAQHALAVAMDDANLLPDVEAIIASLDDPDALAAITPALPACAALGVAATAAGSPIVAAAQRGDVGLLAILIPRVRAARAERLATAASDRLSSVIDVAVFQVACDTAMHSHLHLLPLLCAEHGQAEATKARLRRPLETVLPGTHADTLLTTAIAQPAIPHHVLPVLLDCGARLLPVHLVQLAKSPVNVADTVPPKMQVLLDAGAPINAWHHHPSHRRFVFTAVQAAAAYGNLPLTSWLVERGGDLRARDSLDMTAFQNAFEMMEKFPTSCRQAVKAGADYPGAITLLSRAKAWQRRRHLVELYRRAFCAADVTSDDDDIRDAALATQAAAAAALGGAGTHAVDKDSVALETARAARAAALSVDAPPVDAPPEAYGIHPVASAATAAAAVAGPVRPLCLNGLNCADVVIALDPADTGAVVVEKAAAAVGIPPLARQMHIIVLGRYVQDEEVVAPLLIRDCASRELQPKAYLLLLSEDVKDLATATAAAAAGVAASAADEHGRL